MKKERQPQYIINSTTVIEAQEKRIVENCFVEICAPITVFGKLVFRNCTIQNVSGSIDVYGVLKLETCHVWTDMCFLNIRPGGEYQCDIFDFNDNSGDFVDYISGFKKESFRWIENPPPVEEHFRDVLISCVSKHYGVEICGECPKEYSDDKRKLRKNARRVALYLNEKLGLSRYKMQYVLGIPHRLDGVCEDVEHFIRTGDVGLWKEIAKIAASILKEIYCQQEDDQQKYPYRD